ncbi:MAG TPA: DUF1579 domain-containing protein [Candidatus Saccharimonadales bacterium]|nr:DUF1579 domain-containing protein [Candidatus Saccharimonadales bacterium]
MKRPVLFLCAALLAAGACAAAADETPKSGAGAQAPAMAFPKPGPEHALLAADVGTWDATLEMTMAPGAPPETTTGVRTVNMICGGLWMQEDIQSTMMGMPFQGRGLTGWDPAKGKYVGVWVDAMSTYVMSSEGTCDKATGTFTMWQESPGPDGKPMKWRTETKSPDPDTRVWIAYMPTPDGKEYVGMKATYKRRK